MCPVRYCIGAALDRVPLTGRSLTERVVTGIVIFERVVDVTLGRTGRRSIYALYLFGATAAPLELPFVWADADSDTGRTKVRDHLKPMGLCASAPMVHGRDIV